MLSCNPPVDDFDFADVLTALTEPALINPDARQLTTDYAKLLPGIVNLPPGERGYPLSAALILCEPLASRNTVAAMLEISESAISRYLHGGRKPTADVAKRAAPVFDEYLHELLVRLEWARTILFADAWTPWDPDTMPQSWLADVSGGNGPLPLRAALQSSQNLSVYQGMLDAGSAYRKRTSECHGHLVREVQAAKVAIQRQGKPGK